MEFRNLTPFDALCFAAVNARDELQRVVVMKVAYKIVRVGQDWQVRVMDESPMQLCTSDQFYGEPGQSSIAQESDLAPYKPKCDVVVKGASHAPAGKAAKSWPARVRLTALQAPERVQPAEVPKPQSLNPLMDLTAEQLAKWQRDKALAQAKADDINQQLAKLHAAQSVLLDKTLTISGPSEFTLGLLGGWQRSTPEATTRVLLMWEHSFGGASVVQDPKSDPKSDPKRPGHLLNEVCYANPIGTGWLERREPEMRAKAKLGTRRSIPAPQIEYPQQTLKEPQFAEHPKPKAGEELDAQRMAQIAAQYGHGPAGFGVLGRSWAPRLAQAGSYDARWLKHRNPKLPQDFNDAYWNGAPADQQTEHLPQNLRVELWNLSDPTQTPNGYLSVELPGHRPFVLMRLDSGAMAPLSLQTDTLVIDTEALTISLTHRLRLPDDMPVRVLEARFEVDPQAPLIKFKGESQAATATAIPTATAN
jgi:hypothetical protein